MELSSAELDTDDPSEAVLKGHFNHSEMLVKLHIHLHYLSKSQQKEVVGLINSYSCFCFVFSDVPSQTHILQNNIGVCGSSPIKQHSYKINLDKREC